MYETVTIQLGQCGNQIGKDFWVKIMEEHQANKNENDRRDKFFYTTEGGKLVPRTVLIDTEPRAIFPEISNSTNTFLTNEGTGASNNWAHGFNLAKTHMEDMMDVINRNIEACDNVESIQVIHSCAGGTGSGFSSFLGEVFSENFPKKILCDFAILPNNNQASDVVVQPYNTVLSLNKVRENFNVVVLMDNYALSRHVLTNKVTFANDEKQLVNTYENMNSVAADVISSFSSSVRFPSYIYAENKSILNALVSSRNLNLVVPSIVTSDYRKYSTGEIVGNLIKQKSLLCNYEESSLYGYKSIWNVMNHALDVSSVIRAQKLVQNKINFIDLPYYTTAFTNRRELNVSFSNTTGIRSALSKITSQFDKLMERKAFLESYRKFELEASEMKAARESINGLIEEYEALEARK
ncbi:TUB4 [Ecytonucleospora hepatopenaei]|uniref:Tubulin gamma chain n=1 Tax=Ecytonucleospora hepatopenaei TaxID=646526 RepID=A0A1W0E4R3_9MICR|nr:TUB4 [Ecytonucleospora hepatopenaei]